MKDAIAQIFQDIPLPTFEEGEEVIRRGMGAQEIGTFDTRAGPLILTNRRLLWTSKRRTQLPFRKNVIEIRLAHVEAADKGSLFNFIFGGMCIRLRMKNRRIQKLNELDGKLDEWIEATPPSFGALREKSGFGQRRPSGC